ncbi:leucine-rich repeat domain-containing protein [Kordia sp.]|uniref:leucine-rich repeat domain-containing protein n=1 Tax=Kordia sp. TaxID=1965332 RepID=UPI003D28A5BA
MSKPQEILELEKVYGIMLKETKDEKDFMYWENTNLYLLNDEQQIVGLNLSSNQIQEIKNLNTLINLQKLNISGNQIQEMKNLDNLINLQELYIHNNQIQEIKNLDNLINLQKLYIYNNQIQEIKDLDNLKNLQQLDISSNQISEIKNLDKLTYLTLLKLYSNQISEIKNLDKLINLQQLDISSNQIQEIDFLKSILKLPELYYLEVDHNPFLEAENLILKSNENHLDTIKSSLQKLEETQISIQLPVKVMLLGNHASGKSTLLTYLQTEKCSKIDKTKNSSTHVLSVQHSKETINYKLPKAIFYDFGGQDYYHGIYRAFFTQETVNLLVWHPKSNHNELLVKDSNTFATRNYRRDYWLAQLQYAFDKKNTDKEKVYDESCITHSNPC